MITRIVGGMEKTPREKQNRSTSPNAYIPPDASESAAEMLSRFTQTLPIATRKATTYPTNAKISLFLMRDHHKEA